MKFDEPRIVSINDDKDHPEAIRGLQNWARLLGTPLRSLAASLATANALAKRMQPIVYGTARTTGSGGNFSHRHSVTARGTFSGAASGITATATAIRLDLAVLGLAIAGDPFRASLLVTALNDATDWFVSERIVGGDIRTPTLFFMQTRNAANLLINPSAGFGPVGVNFSLFGETA